MATVTIISVGTIKESYLKDALSEYKKRISQFARLEEAEIREERIFSEDNHAEIKKALLSEGERILAAVPKGAYKIALCIEGTQHTSEELAGIIDGAASQNGKIAFIIGSSHGLSPEVKAACDMKLSFSRLTFPHQLMRVVLAEAIYRSFTIIAGKKYHK